MSDKKREKKIVKVVDIVPSASHAAKIRRMRDNEENDFDNFDSVKETDQPIIFKRDKNDPFRMDAEPPKEEKETKTSKRHSQKWVVWTTIVVAFLVLVYLAISIFPRVDVLIVTNKKEWNNEGSIIVNKNIGQLDVNSMQVPGEIVEKIVNRVLKFEPTGKKYLERKASGQIVIYNAFSSAPQKLVATTRFETPDGKFYRIPESIEIPGAKIEGGKITPSSIPVEVFADKAGPSYNSGAIEKLTIPGFKNTSKYEGFYASASNGFSGGFIGEGLYPTNEDIKKAKEQAQIDLQDALSASLISQIKEDTTYIKDSVLATTTKLSVSSNVGADNKFSVVAEGKVMVMTFRETDILELLKQKAKKDNLIPSEYEEKSKDLSYNKPQVDWKLGKMVLPIVYKAVFVKPFDVNQLKNEIMGKSDLDLRKYIADKYSESINKLTARFWPFYVGSVPNNANKINITIE
ncbi:MAG TPA: hypothetical protein PK367_00790 [Candidatus Paceibacterota bacterium]|nr:hypothetical protein [Candidatus Paceibacterota bacterium]